MLVIHAYAGGSSINFPVDLSNVLFICSANITDTISAPLLDRMDIIQLSSYTNEEKKMIYKIHLLPRAIQNVTFPFLFNILKNE